MSSFDGFLQLQATALHYRWFLNALTKLRKVTTSFVVFVRPSVRMEHLGSYWTEFYDSLYVTIFRIQKG